MSITQLIKDYVAENPKATPKEIALVCKCPVTTVYNVRASLKEKQFPKPKADLVRSEAKLLTDIENERLIKSLQKTQVDLCEEIKSLKDSNYLYVKRELKLLGVIDYLESKVNAASV